MKFSIRHITSKIKSYLSLWGVVLLSRLLMLLPFFLLHYLAMGIGGVLYYVLSKRRAIARHHLNMVYPELTPKEVNQRLKGIFKQFALIPVEFLIMPKIYRKLCTRQAFTVKNKNYLDEALAKNKGVVLLTGHIGSWEVCGVIIARLNYQLNVIMRELNNRKINDYVVKQREEFGIKLITRPVMFHLKLKNREMSFKDESSGRKVKACLKKNEIVAFLADQNAFGRGPVVEFMGFPASTVVGPVVYAQKAEAPIIPVVCVRKGKFKYEIIFGPPFDPDINTPIEDNINRMNAILEDYIHQFPEQWLWIHRRWDPEVYDQRAKRN